MGVLARLRGDRDGGEPRSMTASAARIKLDDRSELERMRRRMERWQPAAWDYYDFVGEAKYGINKLADACSKVRLIPGVQDDPEEDPIPANEAEGLNEAELAAAYDCIRRLAFPVGHSENMRRLAVNFSVPGECYLVGMAAREGSPERWEIRSTEDVVASPSGGVALIDGPDVRDWIPLRSSDLLTRLWVPHPRKAWRPDSGLRGVLSVCEELLILDRSSRAVLRSRNNAGILTVPQELGLGPADPTSDKETEDPFFDELMESMTEPIAQEGSASAVMPYLLYGKSQYLGPDVLRHIDLSRGIDERHDQRTERLLRRLANGINMPAEVILGMTDVNHWTAWQIEDSTFKAHVEPVVILGCSSLTAGYFRPMFAEYEGVRPETVARMVVWYDASKLVARPNRAGDAKDLNDRGAISNRALRDASDFDESDAPTDEELAEMMAWRKAGRPALGAGGEPNEAPNEKPQPKDEGPPATKEQPDEDDDDAKPGESQTASAHTQRLLTEPITAALAPSSEGERDGAIIGLIPEEKQAAAIAVEGGDPPERLHVTLAFLGKLADLSEEQQAAIVTAAEAAASTSGPLSGTLAGIGHFDTAANDEGLVPCVALVDAQGLSGLRSRSMAALAEQGVESPSDHDFTPHMTLGYHEAGEHPTEADGVAGLEVSFSELVVRFGEEEQRFALSGDAVVAAARPRRSSAARIGDRQMEIDRALKERLVGAFDQSMRRALERAGTKLITKAKASRDGRLKELVSATPKLEVAGKLGPALVRSLGLSAETLLAGAFEELGPRFDRWTEQAQGQALDLIPNLGRGEGALAEATFRTDRAEAWAWTSGELMRLAGERLFEPDPREPERGEFDSSVLVSYSVVRGALARAGGCMHEPVARVAAIAEAADAFRFILGLATGWFIRRHLDEHDILTRGYMWDYGAFARTRPFEPHADLDGIEFSNFDDPVLANRDSFPSEAFYLPGDHDGCGCDFHPMTEER